MTRPLSMLSILLALSIAWGLPQSVDALEIENIDNLQMNYCSVTIKRDDGVLYTILVLEINLPKILEQLNVIDSDCSIVLFKP